MSDAAVLDRPTVQHVIQGTASAEAAVEYEGFATPELDLDALVWPRDRKVPALDTPLAEIMDVLVEAGSWLQNDPDHLVRRALESLVRTSPLPADLLERAYEQLPGEFGRRRMESQVQAAFGGADVLDGWRGVETARGGQAKLRAFPARLVHVIAGNAPSVAALTVVRGALTKGVNLIKLPSNDLVTVGLLLRALAAVAPGHPLSRSFSAVYWRGGDRSVEGVLFRPQFFDKLVAWGGETTIRNAREYVGAGFELVSFDPKTSISLIGKEAFESQEVLAEVADRAAADVTVMNQQACVSSRFQFIEADMEGADRYAALLQRQLGVERTMCSASQSLPQAMRDDIRGVTNMEPFYRVFASGEGEGTVVRSELPVDFHPDGRVVNVVPVEDLQDALSHVSIATQTVGIFPSSRVLELRDALASRGTQRITALGRAIEVREDLPWDGFIPLQRLIRWVNDES